MRDLERALERVRVETHNVDRTETAIVLSRLIERHGPSRIDVTEHRIRQRLWRDADTNAFLDSTLSAMESGAATPFTVADELLSRSVDLLTRTRS